MLDKIARDNPAEHAKDLEEQIAAFSVYDTIGRPELREEWTAHYFEDNKPERIWKERDALKQLRDLGFADVRVVKRYGMHALIVGTKA